MTGVLSRTSLMIWEQEEGAVKKIHIRKIMMDKFSINKLKSIIIKSETTIISSDVYIPMHRVWMLNMTLYEM